MTPIACGHALGILTELAVEGQELVMRSPTMPELECEPIARRHALGWVPCRHAPRGLVSMAYRRLREAGVIEYRGRRDVEERAVWELQTTKTGG